MESKFIEFLFRLNAINKKFKDLSDELDKLNSDFFDEDFEHLFIAEQLRIVVPEDYE